MKKPLAILATCAVAVSGLTLAVALPSQAADSDGTLTVTVVNDRNLNSSLDAADIDESIDGATVTLTDAEGTSVSGTTDDGRAFSFDTSSLVGGSYRVEVQNPDAQRWTSATVLTGADVDYTAGDFSPTVSFVDLSDGTDADVTVGFVDHTTLGPENGSVFSAIQDNMKNPGGETTELFTLPVTLDTEKRALTQRGDFGTVYGIGVDDRNQQVYLGAYAKRGSAYGDGGPGAIYRYSFLTDTADAQPWAIVPDAGTDTHDWDDDQDLDYREKVGREALGDIDVSADGKWLTAVNLRTDELVTYPVQQAANPEPAQRLVVEPMDGCSTEAATGTWAPFALDEHDGGLYVGATCGETMELYLLDYSRAADGTLTFEGVVAQGNADDVSTRHQPNEDDTDFNNDAANLVADQYRNPNCRLAPWNPWNDDLATVPSQFDGIGDCVNDDSHPFLVGGTTPGAQITYPQPMLADIEVLGSGDFVFSFRDRGSDQYGYQEIYGINAEGTRVSGDYITTGDQVRVRLADGELEFPTENDFIDAATQEYNGVHKQAAYAGIAYVESGDLLVGNQMDAAEYGELGLRVWDAATGTPQHNVRATRNFYKNAGLSDVEVLVREATQQIGDYLWFDADRDGVQDAGELPVVGALVALFDEDGNQVGDPTSTDEFGRYYFDVAADTGYEVRVLPENFVDDGVLVAYAPTAAQTGADVTVDSNGESRADDGALYVGADVDGIAEGTQDHDFDFGFVEVVSIGDYVWFDANNNGRQDEGEKPAAGVTVTLTDADGVTTTTETDANGYYAFRNLVPGAEYTVTFPTTIEDEGGVPHALVSPRATEDGATEAENLAGDSDPNPATGEVKVTAPAWVQGESRNLGTPGDADDPTIDAGYSEILVSIGDFVWFDEDGDGIQDEDEDPIAGVIVRLLDENGAPVTDADGNDVTAETDAEGYYVFPNLPTSTTYIVEFPTQVKHTDGHTYGLTEPEQIDENSDEPIAVDSNPATDTGRTEVITTPATGSNSAEHGLADLPTIDAGYTPANEMLVSIGDLVWLDEDGDGIQDEGELPLGGVQVTLQDANGDVIATTETDEDGTYFFDDLLPDTDYTVVFPETVVLSDGRTIGLTQQSDDPDADGIDSNPSADGAAPVHTPTTGRNATAYDDTDVPTIDAGYTPANETLVSIGDYVWLDADRDGIQDDGETPIAGITVTLLDANGDEVATTTTNERGYYVFPNLPTNTDFTVVFPTTSVVDGHTYGLSDAEQGTDDQLDSNADPVSGRAAVRTPAGGDNSTEEGEADDPSIDAGYGNEKLVSIGDYVWLDEDGNGLQDENTPLSGIEVILLDADGNEVATAITNERGYYAFGNLLPDTDYAVKFPTSVKHDGHTYGLSPKGDDQGAGDDSNADPVNGLAPVHTPTEGNNSVAEGEADDPTIDAGYGNEKLVSIGDYVWHDANGNGTQDAGEKPVPGVEVTLYDKDGKKVATTKTDENGFYGFDGLLPETEYFVEFPPTIEIDGETYELTPQGTDPNSGDDSNADPKTGRASVITPADGNNSIEPGLADDPTIDAGYVLAPVDEPVTPITPGDDGDEDPTDGSVTPIPDTGTVDDTDQGDADPALPATGAASSMPLGAFALLLIMGGAFALVIRRRQRA